jgi:enoyl-CoA hydratase
MTEPLLVEHHDDVLVLSINRPEARNSVDARTAQAIASTLDDFENDEALTVAVLTGSGGTFCAGMDLKGFARGDTVVTHRGMLGATERPPAKPMIAAVEGWALAGGCELALSCDLIVAADDAKFGIPEVKRGIIAAAGGLRRLPLALPYHLAMELALTGEPLPARRAYELGMVNRIAKPGDVLAGALDLAAAIKRNGPLAVRTSKQIMSTATGWDDPSFWAYQQESANMILASHDALEGATAFAEKREPSWSGT